MLKIIKVFLIGIACLAGGFVNSVRCGDSSAVLHGKQVIVYYFHGNFRCPTCKKLEQYSSEAVDQNFGAELKQGKIAFKPVNVDRKENEHFVNDYQLYTKSLVLSLVKNGKEVKNKNLTKIWELVGNKNKFTDYVKNELETFIKGK